MVDPPKEVSKMVPTDPKRSYVKALFELHPTVIPTQALCLDLEGSGGGSEEILSVYWPFLPSDQRFSWLKRTATTEIDLLSINELVQRIGADRAKSLDALSFGINPIWSKPQDAHGGSSGDDNGRQSIKEGLSQFSTTHRVGAYPDLPN